jgi:ABC-type Fe3+/spermidine/putrescine transport system ATPase subunit
MKRLSISGLHKHYRNQPALSGIDLDLRDGVLLGLFGANGSGKSTLLRCIAGIDKPDAGRILIDGIDIGLDPVGARARLGYAVDTASLPPQLSGRQCIELVARVRGRGASTVPWALVEALDLTRWLDHSVETCSLGTRQKLSVVLALIGEPSLLPARRVAQRTRSGRRVHAQNPSAEIDARTGLFSAAGDACDGYGRSVGRGDPARSQHPAALGYRGAAGLGFRNRAGTRRGGSSGRRQEKLAALIVTRRSRVTH